MLLGDNWPLVGAVRKVEFSLRHVRNYKLGRVEKPRANEPLI